MDMPQPTDAHRKLEKLAGHWIGDEKISPSPWDPVGGAAVGRVNNRVVLDGFAVVQDYEQERGGRVSFRGLGVFQWDAMANEYVMHWLDSMGTPANTFRGQFDGDVLTLASQNPMGFCRAVMDFSRPDSYAFRMDISQDGQAWSPFMEGAMSRAEPPKQLAPAGEPASTPAKAAPRPATAKPVRSGKPGKSAKRAKAAKPAKSAKPVKKAKPAMKKQPSRGKKNR